ncbi:MAG: quinone oxidoreductase [Bryobacteraceae bacterium]|nr:quinone oxidoreductase [Bryobacteraceae bacterium]
MRAIRVHQTGGPEVLTVEDIATPQPQAAQVLVRVAAAGVNFIDIYHRTGLYKLPLPFTPGGEAAGTVESVGPGVDAVKPGDRVTYVGPPGSYAEFAVVPASVLLPVPPGLDLKLAAAAMLQGMTAHYLVHSVYPLKQGDTCLVHAAAGGTGRIIVQMAKMLGARVIGTTSTEEKAEEARRCGADETILYTSQDFEVEARRITDGRGVDVVYDSVGKTTWDKSLNCLRLRGMMVSFGNASGAVDPIAPLILNQKGSLFLTRPKLQDYIASPDELQWRAGDVLNWVASGKLDLKLDGEYSLDQAGQAHEDLASRKTSGKLLLVP